MKNDKTFKSKVSKWISGLYITTLIFLFGILIVIPFFAPMTFFEKSVFIITFFFVIMIFVFLILKMYRLSFIISNDKIRINGLLKKHEIMLSEIKEVKKVPIPFGFRLYGASFLGGRYYLPGIGKATVAMSNFDDGVLITTKKGDNFVITPTDPVTFVNSLK